MANLPNLAAAAQADFTSDNTMIGLAGLAGASVGPGVTFKSSATEGVALAVGKTNVGSPTVALFAIGNQSTASAPAIQIIGQSFVSCTTILFTTGGTAGTGVLRVAYPDGVTLGWIPILPSGAVTAVPRG
jgi:hypothetical protein